MLAGSPNLLAVIPKRLYRLASMSAATLVTPSRVTSVLHYYPRGGTFTSIARKGTHVTKLDQLIEHLLKRNMRLLNASLDQRLPNYERLAAEIREEELSEAIGLLMELRDETTPQQDLDTLLPSARATD